jgi:hypothetical protein
VRTGLLEGHGFSRAEDYTAMPGFRWDTLFPSSKFSYPLINDALRG